MHDLPFLCPITRFAWTVKSSVPGVCVGTMMSTSQVGDRRDMRTFLMLETPAAAPFR